LIVFVSNTGSGAATRVFSYAPGSDSNSPGVAQSRSPHSFETMWFPGCPAGCSHREPCL
jgi:hypothetical protein